MPNTNTDQAKNTTFCVVNEIPNTPDTPIMHIAIMDICNGFW